MAARAPRGDGADQLETGAIAILTTERQQALVDTLPATVPLTETLMVLRVMQQALIFALSADPAVRARAVDVKMVATYARLAEIKWREHEGMPAPGGR